MTSYTEHAYDHTAATHLIKHLAPKLLGKDPRMREQLFASLQPDVGGSNHLPPRLRVHLLLVPRCILLNPMRTPQLTSLFGTSWGT